MFNTREPKDRLEMMESLGYGGQIPPAVAAYTNKDLPRQSAIIKKNKEEPVRVRMEDTPDVKISQEKLDAYIQKLLEQPWYLTKKEIKDQINERIKDPINERKNPVRPQPPKAPDSKAPVTPVAEEREPPDTPRDSEEKPPTARKRKPLTF